MTPSARDLLPAPRLLTSRSASPPPYAGAAAGLPGGPSLATVARAVLVERIVRGVRGFQRRDPRTGKLEQVGSYERSSGAREDRQEHEEALRKAAQEGAGGLTTTAMVRPSRMRHAEGFRPRRAATSEKVAAIAERYRAGHELRKPVLVEREGRPHILDGNHRVEAWRRVHGDEPMEVHVPNGLAYKFQYARAADAAEDDSVRAAAPQRELAEHDRARDEAAARYRRAVARAVAALEAEALEEARRRREKRKAERRDRALAAAALLLLLAGAAAYKRMKARLGGVSGPPPGPPAPTTAPGRAPGAPAAETRPPGKPGPGAGPSGAASLDAEARAFAASRAKLAREFLSRTLERLDKAAKPQAWESDDEAADRLAAEAEAVEQGAGEVVAQTEAQATYGSAQMRTLRQAGFTHKVWTTMEDERVRPSHVECGEQGAVPLDKPFANGLMYPGDPNGGPEEVCNCRCWLTGQGRRPGEGRLAASGSYREDEHPRGPGGRWVDKGYHYGDLRAAPDTALPRLDAGRSTGHYGTGTYFFGKPEAPGSEPRKGRPLRVMELAGLRLARPLGQDAVALHDSLREFNRAVLSGEPLDFSEPRHRGAKAAFGVRLALGLSRHSPEQVRESMLKVERMFREGEHDRFRSPSTYLMQDLGYEGVDVRGTPADTGDYGSVVYYHPKRLSGMALARQLVRLPHEAIREAAPSFNTVNLPLGQQATDEELEELAQLHGEATDRWRRHMELATAAKGEEQERLVRELGSVGTLPQFYSEAVREGLRRRGKG